MACLLVFLLIVTCVPPVRAAEASGTCGANLTWTLSGDTLTITGSGAMYDFPEETMSPWYAYRREISAVNLPEGLTRIGDLAFYECSALKTVIMPDSVTEVGWYAFAGCTAMTMLDLSSGLRTIEDSAFRECSALPTLRLPESLTSIGDRGFYRCESLTEITIPASVAKLGLSAFSFCYNLVRADIRAPLVILPDWTFYGCSRLTDISLPSTMTGVSELAFYDCTSLDNVVYTGSEANREQIAEDIQRDLEGIITSSPITNEGYGDSSSSVTVEETDDRVIANSTTTTQTENATISSNVTDTYPKEGESTSNAQVDVTLENAEGWNEVSQKVTDIVKDADKTDVDVYIKDNSVLPDGALTDLAGENVIITVHTPDGSVWKIDCSTQVKEELQNAYDLSCERAPASAEQLELMQCTAGYQIRFTADAEINAEILIKLPVEHARQRASLFQIARLGELQLLQTVVVDDEGYAHFYLASVEQATEYLIGIDVQMPEAENALIPEPLHESYGLTNDAPKMEYVLTGRKSSWGINIQQVTWIMFGAMFVVVLTVGLVMYSLNKRKLRMGYVPDLDDEEEDE